MNRIGFDFETTGAHPGCRPVELAAIRYCDDGSTKGIFETLINPECPILPDAVETHGITADMVMRAPTFDDVWAAFLEWLGDDRLFVMHHAPFDVSVACWNAARAGLPVPHGLEVIDTCRIARALKRTPDNKLQTLVNHYQLERSGPAHRALADAHAAMTYLRMIESDPAVDLTPKTWEDVQQYDYPSELPEVLADLPELVRVGLPMTFRYADKDGNESERTITPWGWALQGGEVNVHGWCHLRQEKRQFRADRIVSRLLETAEA